MKKSLIFSGLIALAVAVSSCGNERDTIIQKPADGSFKLNDYPFQSEYIDLETAKDIELTCSQPDYGFAAIANYSLDVALTDDFSDEKKVYNIKPQGSGTLAKMVYSANDLATAITTLHGYTSSEEKTDIPACPVYCRAVCEIAGAPDSRVVSNVIKLDKVKTFFAVREPAFIYCIGNYAGDWIGPEEGNYQALKPYRLTEQIIDSKIFYGEIQFTADENPTFRFYTALTGWDDDSWGSDGGKDDDNPVENTWNGAEPIALKVIKTKDSFKFTSFKTCTLAMTVNMTVEDDYNVIFSKVN